MMLQRNNYRIVATGGGFGISLSVHLAVFLLIGFLMRVGPQDMGKIMDELTEIAYIEARYGEDVAKQVRMKTKPIVKPEPKAEKIEPEVADTPAKPVEKKAEPKPESVKPKLEDIDIKVAAIKPKIPEFKLKEPKLKNRSQLVARQPKIATRSVLKNKPLTDINAPKPLRPQMRSVLETSAKRLDSKHFADAGLPKVDTSQLRNRNMLSADVGAPRLTSRQAQVNDFESKPAALVGRRSSLDLGDVDFEVSSGSGSAAGALTLQLATGGSEDGHAGLVGGRLEEGQVAYQGAVADLLPTEPERRLRQPAVSAVLDVEHGADPNARRTLLDYGQVTGMDGGANLHSRGDSATAVVKSTPIIDKTDVAPETPVLKEVATVLVPKKGVSMVVSGQIADRKIISSVLPQYSAEARKRGWEGSVAVHFTVKYDGTVQSNLYFDQTSAHRDLNRAAIEAIKQFKFEPLQGSLAEQWGVITIVFRLN